MSNDESKTIREKVESGEARTEAELREGKGRQIEVEAPAPAEPDPPTESTTDLRKVLAAWSVLEPQRCEAQARYAATTAYRIDCGDYVEEIHDTAIFQTRAVVFAAVSAAIEKRGWWLKVEYSEDGHPLWWEAEVTIMDQGAGRWKHFMAQAGAAEAALLDAYVQALNFIHD